MKEARSPNSTHLEEASKWFVALSHPSVSDKDRDAWQSWMNENIQHRRAWKHVESVGVDFLESQNDGKRSLQRFLKCSKPEDLSRRHFIKGAAGIAGVSSLAWFAFHKTPVHSYTFSMMADFNTGIGQLSSHVFEDGTKVWLNTQSAINQNYSLSTRNIEIVGGEIMVQTDNQNDDRMFVVSCMHGLVRADKARFCFRHVSHNQALLSVHEGEVLLAPSNSSVVKTVSAGEAVMFTNESVSYPWSIPAHHESWVDRQLIVDNMPLSDFIEELSRYFKGHISLDKSLSQLIVKGNFPTGDPISTLRQLSRILPIQVNENLPFWISVSSISDDLLI